MLSEKRLQYQRKWRKNNPEKIKRYGIEWRKSNPEKIKASARRDYEKNRGTEKALMRKMLNHAQERARKKGLPCNIELDDIVIPEFCPALGLPLGIGLGRWSPTSPSLDRIVSTKGYVKGNVQVISAKANNIKSDGSPEDVMKVALFMRRSQ